MAVPKKIVAGDIDPLDHCALVVHSTCNPFGVRLELVDWHTVTY